jgi:hypothetical protein
MIQLLTEKAPVTMIHPLTERFPITMKHPLAEKHNFIEFAEVRRYTEN